MMINQHHGKREKEDNNKLFKSRCTESRDLRNSQLPILEKATKTRMSLENEDNVGTSAESISGNLHLKPLTPPPPYPTNISPTTLSAAVATLPSTLKTTPTDSNISDMEINPITSTSPLHENFNNSFKNDVSNPVEERNIQPSKKLSLQSQSNTLLNNLLESKAHTLLNLRTELKHNDEQHDGQCQTLKQQVLDLTQHLQQIQTQIEYGKKEKLDILSSVLPSLTETHLNLLTSLTMYTTRQNQKLKVEENEK